MGDDMLLAFLLILLFMSGPAAFLLWSRHRPDPSVYLGSPAHRALVARVDAEFRARRAVMDEAEATIRSAHRQYGSLYEAPTETPSNQPPAR